MPKTIAVVVRDPQLRAGLTTLLERAGARVVQGGLGTRALNMAQDGTVDLMFLDLHLEDAHGDDVLRDIRQDPRGRALPVVMLIQEADDWFQERAADSGAQAVLTYAEVPTRAAPVAGGLLRTEARLRTPGQVRYYLVESRVRTIFEAEVADVSLSGLALDAKVCELEPEFVLDVRLSLPQLEPVMGRARVVRLQPASEGYRITLTWQGFRSGDRDRLAAWIRERAAPAGGAAAE